MEAARLRAQDQHDRDVWLAWHAVAIYANAQSTGRVPDARKWLSGSSALPASQSTGQMRSTLELLSAQYGYPVVTGQSKRKH